MAADSEPIDKPNELAQIIVYPFDAVNFKASFLLFFLFLFVSSNIFIDQVLSRFSDTTSAGQITIKGIIIQGIILVMLFIIAQIITGFDLI